MATLRITILKSKELRNGGYKIQVALAHRGKTSYIPTRFIVHDISELKNGNVVKCDDASEMNYALRNLLNQYQNILDNIHNINIYSCAQLKKVLQNRYISQELCTFQDIAADYIASVKKQGREKYASLLTWSCEIFSNFLKAPFPIDEIDGNLLTRFSYLLQRDKQLSNSSINSVLAHIKVIINYAITLGYARYNIHPFRTIKIQKSQSRDCSLTQEELKKLLLYKPQKEKYQLAYDLFFLSLFLGGANLIDLLSNKFSAGVFSYTRCKTKNRSNTTVTLPITEEARSIIEKRIDNTGRIKTRYKLSYRNLCSYIGACLREIGKELNIQNLMFYSARKTFAQIALQLGISDTIVNYCLGHSNFNRGIIGYYSHVDTKQAEQAIQKVNTYIRFLK